VIGAGLAGLAAAWRLARDGFAVTLLERADRPGGRAAAHRERGFAFEPAPALLTRGDRRLIEWIGEVGLQDELLPLRPLKTAVAHRGEVRDAEVRRLFDVRRVPGVSPLQALRLVRLPRLLARYADALDLEVPERAAALDDRSLADFCTLYFGRSVLDLWMGPRMTAESLGDAERMSRVQFLHHYRAHALARRGLPRGGLGEGGAGPVLADLGHDDEAALRERLQDAAVLVPTEFRAHRIRPLDLDDPPVKVEEVVCGQIRGLGGPLQNPGHLGCGGDPGQDTAAKEEREGSSHRRPLASGSPLASSSATSRLGATAR